MLTSVTVDFSRRLCRRLGLRRFDLLSTIGWASKTGFLTNPSWDQYYKTDFAATQLMARFWCIIWVCTCNFAISIWSSPNATYIAAANKYFWTQLVPQIMHQNLAILLWQFCYGKISFIVLVPGSSWRRRRPTTCTSSPSSSISSWRV